jgi:hypothetical protein
MADDDRQAQDGEEPREEVAAGDPESPLQLGTCHYGGLDEAATTMAVREDGTGWIGICDDHREEAEKDGFAVREDVVP